MTVHELNRDQLMELKARYYTDKTGRDLSMSELADIDNIVSDYEIYDRYEGYSFRRDDFFSSGEPESEYDLEIGDCIGDRDSIAHDLRQIADLIEGGYYSGIADYGTSWSIM